MEPPYSPLQRVTVSAVALFVGDQDTHVAFTLTLVSEPPYSGDDLPEGDLLGEHLGGAARSISSWIAESSRAVITSTGMEGLASYRSLTISGAPSSGRGMSTMAASMPPSAILRRPSATEPP